MNELDDEWLLLIGIFDSMTGKTVVKIWAEAQRC